jgi:2'-5' RNA ligase
VETKPFRPHLTLARIREPEPLDQLQRTIASLASNDFGVFQATEFHLYRSVLQPGGSVYTKLASFPLSA